MKIILAGFCALVTLAWGISFAAHGAGPASLPWLLREQTLYLSGLLSIALMSLAMVLATRPAWLERPFGGMDRVYRTHKWAGILAAVFAALHWAVKEASGILKALVGTAGRPPKMEYSGLIDSLRHLGKDVGEIGIYIALALVLLSLWKRFPYKFWRHVHRVMPALYLALAFHAAALTPMYWWTSPAGIVLGVLLAAGTVAAGVSLSGRIGRVRQASGQVVALAHPAADVTEVVCRLDEHWRGHRAGQFAFVTFDRTEGAHPFTIASADQGDRTVSFQIKALGDYTGGLAEHLRVGQPVRVEGPYGLFELDRRDRSARQVWVAGGIGVTPFLAWLEALRADPAAAPAADLHYCTRRAAGDPFVTRLKALCADLPGVRLRVHDSASDGLPDAGMLGLEGTAGERAEVWFCGPRGLAEHLRAGLARLGVYRLRFHQEAFEMR